MSNEFTTSKTFNSKIENYSIEEIRKGIWLTSILAGSKVEEHVKKAQLLAALMHLNLPDNIDISRACYIIFSRTGNLIATKFLTNIFNSNYSEIQKQKIEYDFDFALDLELANIRDESLINIDATYYLTTRFQKHLWATLNKKNNVSISAPTSSGKSFIIKKYIKNLFQTTEILKVLYIVPSRALINQVSEEFSIDLNPQTIDIKTAFIGNSELDRNYDKQIYILTPERCLRLLQHIWNSDFKLDLIFVDEIQNVEEENGRGTLLEYVLRELALLKNKTQLITAGPNINNTEDLFQRIFGSESIQVQTSVSPVFQIRTILRPTESSIKIRIQTQESQTASFDISTDTNLKRSFSENIGSGLSGILNIFGKKGQNLIYCPRTDYVETWALRFSETISNINQDSDVMDLVKFLKEEIHPKYYLIPCLQKGIAFHHGKLPDIVRKEIEDLFLEGKIKYLFCTSTLLEGVNLPANNLFIVLPRKRTENLSQFEFGNLIGRAGRVRDSLYGTVYCVERAEEEEWAENYYSKTYNKEVLTVSEKSLAGLESSTEYINTLFNSNDNKDINTFIFLKHKMISSEYELLSYLRLKKLQSESIELMLTVLKETIKEVSLEASILKLNPSIDPILQDTLYRNIRKDGIEKWAITPNANFYKRITKEKREDYSFNKLSFYWQLVTIIENMDSIFSIQKETYFKQNISISIAQMCVYGLNWVENKSYKQLIDQDLQFYSQHLNPNKRISLDDTLAVNVRINQVIKINTTVVSYVLVKYLKLLSDILGYVMSDEEKEQYKFSLALPIMMELGTTENAVIRLISKGIPRTIALKIHNTFEKVEDKENIDILQWLLDQTSIGLEPIYERYLVRLKLLKTISI